MSWFLVTCLFVRVKLKIIFYVSIGLCLLNVDVLIPAPLAPLDMPLRCPNLTFCEADILRARELLILNGKNLTGGYVG